MPHSQIRTVKESNQSLQFNSSLNKQESILSLTQATKEQKVQELLLSVTRMSPNGVWMQARDWEEKEKRLLRTTCSGMRAYDFASAPSHVRSLMALPLVGYPKWKV